MSQTKEFRLIRGIVPLFADLGLDPPEVMRAAGLPADLLVRDDPKVSTAGYFALWNAIESLAADPVFPIRVAKLFGAEGFTPPVFAAVCSPNLTVALRRLSQYKRLVAPTVLDVERGPDGLAVACRFIEAVETPPPSLVAMEAAFVTVLARKGTRERVVPAEVVMPELPAAVGAYEEFFGISVAVGDRMGLRFTPADADRPFLTADDSMWKIFEPELRRRLAALEEEASAAERVRAALLEGLPSGRASIGEIAGQLGASTRTLQRRLHAEATSFQAILNETRTQLAIHYLSTSDLPCNEISFLLGYEEPNSFFRAFQEWTGESPEHLRQRLAG